jgi:PKD repeat protein
MIAGTVFDRGSARRLLSRVRWRFVVALAPLALAPVIVDVAAAAVQAQFGCSPSCAVTPGTRVTFTSSSTSSTPIRNYEWDLDGDSLFGAADTPDEPYGPAATTTQRVFSTAGSHTVRLRVTNAGAEESTATKTVIVAAPPPPPPPPPPAPDPERNATAQTGWHWYYGVSEAKVKTLIAQLGDRIVDIEVERTSPHRFAVAMVHNTGVYARGWWWYFGLSATALKQKITENGARIIDLETYVVGGKRRFAAVLVHNTGVAAKNWHWYYGVSASKLKQRLKEHASRLIDFETYTSNGKRRFAAVMIRNSGVDTSGWWWWFNVKLSKVKSSATSHKARTFALDRLPNGRYNAIQIKRKGEFSAYEIGMDARRAGDFVSQNVGRIVDIDTYRVSGERRFAIIVNDNADAFNARVRAIARTSSGLQKARFGMYVKQVNGPTQISLGGDRVFEPASVLKTLHHLYLHRKLEVLPGENLAAIVKFPTCPDKNRKGTCDRDPKDDFKVCPTKPDVTATGSMALGDADAVMMSKSDNRTTYAIEQRYGRATLNNYAKNVVGTTNTTIRHNIGCPKPSNDTTLVDMGRMIEGASNGTLLATAAARTRFFDTMIQAKSVADTLQDLIKEEATAAGKPGVASSFINNTVYRGKGGTYGKSVTASSGRILLPFKVGGVIQQRAFAYGHFLNCKGCTGDTTLIDVYKKASIEKFRAPIRAALTGW